MSGCRLKLRESLQSLTKKERQVASFVLDFPAEVTEMSIEELAKASETSTSAVVRLCKRLGYSGYKDFSRFLATDLADSNREDIVYEDIRPGDSVDIIARNVAMSNMKAIENSLQMLSTEQLKRAVDAIGAANRVDFFGIGTSALVAMDAHNKFIRINKVTYASTDPHVQILTATTLQEGDVAVFITYTGENRDILTILDIVKKTKATTVAITRYGKNPVSDACDISLSTSSTETLIRSGAMSSRISQLTIIDILYTSVASQCYNDVKPYLDKTRFAAGRMRGSSK